MIKEFLDKAKKDLPVYISDVRSGFDADKGRPYDIEVLLYDDSVRQFSLSIPEFNGTEETDFVKSYIYATTYNILSALGGKKLTVYLNPGDGDLLEIAQSLDKVFQTSLPPSQRTGYGKALNVNGRILRTLFGADSRFSFEIKPNSEKPGPAELNFPEEKTAGNDSSNLRTAAEKALTGAYLGIDVGGTDIKVAASVDGKLAAFAEYDWFPAEFPNAEQMIDPIADLTRGALEDCGIEKFDAIGLSFPDVVIRNLICGGETHKTLSMRENRERDYEEQFAMISHLGSVLGEFTQSGKVRITNDGNMAAFTSAVEEAAAGKNVSNGFFAHTLGTEIGTGWTLSDGSIPEIPLEFYNCIIDLGSFRQKNYEPNDIRSINNYNTLLPGTLQKYCSQSGVFRLAAKYLPESVPELWKEAADRNFFIFEDDSMKMRSAPEDMRKKALEFFIEAGCSGKHEACSRILREIGEYMAVTWEETEYLLHPATKERSLYGRLVKNPESFRLINEGAMRRNPSAVQYAADDTLANTKLMRQLGTHPKYTVAQFAQAVGSIYYSVM